MDNISFEQIEIGNDIINEDQAKLLKENELIMIQFYESQPVSIILPDHISFKVVEADAVVKGQTAASSYKPALLDNGMRTMVPPHIETGSRVVISTEDGSYVERAKD